jgi:hypothetical protein
VRKPFLVICLLLSACGGAEPEPRVVPAARVESRDPVRPPGTIWRDELLFSIDGGLGAFLQRVEVEASLPNGRFEGFRIVDLQPREFWNGVDLKPGDVVTRVNGMPIERETEAYDAFQALRTASELRVSILRGGVPRVLSYRIAERPGTGKSAPTPAISAAPATPATQPAKTPPPRP